jgi:outer membrane lipoprotein SlyB
MEYQSSVSNSSKKFEQACKNVILGGAAGAAVGGNIGKLLGIPGATFGALIGASIGGLCSLFDED